MLKSAGIEWTVRHAAALSGALESYKGRNRPLGYCEMAGFLFAVSCAPEPVRPAEWLPQVLGERWQGFGGEDEVRRVLELVTALYNRINLEVLERRPALPAGVEVRAEPIANLGRDAPLRRWAAGYADAQGWLEETWDHYRPGKRKAAREFDLALGHCTIVLAFFASRRFAEACRREMRHRGPLAELAARMLESLPIAMAGLADLGRGIGEARPTVSRH